MRAEVFLDTAYAIALSSANDHFHQPKEWALTDCVSFIVMQDRGLRQLQASPNIHIAKPVVAVSPGFSHYVQPR